MTLDAPPSAGGAMDAERVYIPIQPEQTRRAQSRDAARRSGQREIESTWPPIVLDDTCTSPRATRFMRSTLRPAPRNGACPSMEAMTAPLTGVRFQVSCQGWPGSASRSAGNVLLGIFETGLVIAFAADDGRMLWTQRPWRGVTFHAGDLTACARSSRSTTAASVALRLADGRPDWEQKLEGMLTQPSVVHDRVFVGSNNNFLYALDERQRPAGVEVEDRR